MKTRYIPAIVVLIASCIVSVLNIRDDVELMLGMKRLLVVVFLFYIIGTIAKYIILRFVSSQETVHPSNAQSMMGEIDSHLNENTVTSDEGGDEK